MKIITRLFIIFLLIQTGFMLPAQEEQTVYFHNHLTLNTTRLIFREIRLGYERNITAHHVAKIAFGMQWPTSSNSFRSTAVGIVYLPVYYPIVSGFYTSVGYNYLINTKKHFYVSAELYFDHKYYNNKYYRYCVGTDMDSYVSRESMQMNKYGLKFLAGKKVTLFGKGKVGLQLEFYGGIGFQYHQKEITEYGKQHGGCTLGYYDPDHEYPSPKTINSNYITPTFHLGMLISVPFI
jgi:hypothetical protein